MSEENEKNIMEKHPIFAFWGIEEKSGKKAFLIRCDCGETIYYLEKGLFQDPGEVYPGMSMAEFKENHKMDQKLQGMKKQVQRVALAQHAEKYKDCPAINMLKEKAGVTSIQEMPSPFRES